MSVGFATNLADLLQSPPDRISALNGAALVERKVRLLSWMAGHFGRPRKSEYNARTDEPATRIVLTKWPRPILASGWEIGAAIRYPAYSIEHDFNYAADHPIPESYRHYRKMPYDRPTYDLTSVLIAVRPHHGYFGLSYPGVITLDEKLVTHFAEGPTGLHRYLTVTPDQIVRVRETLVQMASSPPQR